MKLALKIASLLMVPFCLVGQNNDSAFDKVSTGWGFELKAVRQFTNNNPGALTFSDVPESLRTVPTHKDDGWFGKPGSPRVIPYSTFNVSDPMMSGFWSTRLAPQYTIWRVTVRGGVNVNPKSQFKTKRPRAGDFDTYHAVNQHGKPQRGTGASLVYYSIYWDNPDSRSTVNPFGEVELRLNKFLSVFSGYSSSETSARLILENGYDRWNSLEKYSTTDFATISTKTAHYFGVRIGITPYVGFSVGSGPIISQTQSTFPSVVSGHSDKKKMGTFVSLDLRLTQTKKN
ncbi:MAG: hypothetical protein Q8Q06_03340 [bacterium]|nr:hypothetical protein [bacterium]